MEDPRTKAPATAPRAVPRSSADRLAANFVRASLSDERGWAWTDRLKAATSEWTPKVTIRVTGVPGSQARDVVKVAVLALTAASSDVTLELTIRADGGLAGIPRETLNLVVLEGLRQLGLDHVEVTENEAD
jgi:hypothetical protein